MRTSSAKTLEVGLTMTYHEPMQEAFRIKLAWIVAIAAAGCLHTAAQAPSVPICSQDRPEAQSKSDIIDAAKAFISRGDVLGIADARKQLKRTSCQLALPEASTTRLPAREICVAARRSHLRIGWSYLCPKCGKWHVNLAGGYWLTADGAAVTCFHVVEPGHDLKEGCLVALDQAEKVLPVVEVLAAKRESDACIVRVVGEGFTPLALNTNIYPGDTVYCYSDPVEHPEYFSAGIVNRFYRPAGSRPSGSRATAAADPTRINVSTDWAPDSSGSAILDECGNVIGHVSTISAFTDEANPKTQPAQAAKPTEMVFHEAVSARDLLRLIRPRR
ncbi:MAG: serine protease [Limisphaerales bacterium]